jgi:uncharacterized protein (TIGR02099 family)
MLGWVLLIMAWAGLHFLIVPRISEFRPTLEQQASRILGVQVQVGEVVARSNGLIPSIELRDVRLLDARGQEALHLPQVLAALSPRSLLLLGFEQLYIDAPKLEVRRAKDGVVWVAGIAMSGQEEGHSPAADWVFSQAELVVRNGTVQYTDEQRALPTLTLTQVDMVVRNRHRTHLLRLDATPPAQWGAPLQLMGEFKQPLLSVHSGNWKRWSGQLYGNFAEIDLARLRPYTHLYADLELKLAQGVGSLRAWLDIQEGQVAGISADVALQNAALQLGQRLEPLEMRQAQGRVGARWLEGGMELSTQGLEFETFDGLRWPGGNVKLNWHAATASQPARSELWADRLDLSALAQIAQRLPLPQDVRDAVDQLAPRGLVSTLKMNWDGPVGAIQKYSAAGQVQGLEIAAWVRPDRGVIPGIHNANVNFELTQSGGKAQVAVRQGSVSLPTYLDEALVPVKELDANFVWTVNAKHISVSSSDLRLETPDGRGSAQFKWNTSPVIAGRAADADGRFPGILDLQVRVHQLNAAQLHRYLPARLDPHVRDYLHASIQSGSMDAGSLKIKGPLELFPFAQAKQGEFQVVANFKDAVFAYSPASLLPADSLPWPALTELSGNLRIDQSVLRVTGKSKIHGQTGLQVTQAQAEISNLYEAAALKVTAKAQGPLGEVVNLVNTSPLGSMTGNVLARATATGVGQYQFKLEFPLAAVQRATVQGAITLAGNDIQVTPHSPRLGHAQGTLLFSERGFGVQGGQARALGGDARIEGVLGAVVPGPKPAEQGLRIQGAVTAEGLRQASELGLVARLAQFASGSASYTATLGGRGGVTELAVNSNLSGMALTLPAPFTKSAESPLALRLETSAVPASLSAAAAGTGPLQDQLKLQVGRAASVVYVRDVSGPEPRVLRGAIEVGLASDESAPLPDTGVLANVNAPVLDMDAWLKVVSQPTAAPVQGESAPLADDADVSTQAMGYWPTQVALRSAEVIVGGRKFKQVVLGGGREGTLWRANMDATEANGYVEYQQPAGQAGGRLYARLSRLTIGPGVAQEVERLLEEQPASIPALDIVVDDFDLRGKKLGRIEIEAVNQTVANAVERNPRREWRLNRFNITMPEAVLTASGNWVNMVSLATPVSTARSPREQRRTALKFTLAIDDAGALLERFGMPGVVGNGKGKIEGRIGWIGSPITFDIASLGADMNVNIETGQFLKTEPGIGRLLGVLSLQSLPRRLTLDFRDVFSDGFAFDFFRGDVSIEQGIARTRNLQMKGLTAAVVMQGQADLARETQNIQVVVVPEINAGGASLLASTINPVWGISSFLAQLIFRKPLIESLTQEYVLDGTWVEPRVTKVERK